MVFESFMDFIFQHGLYLVFFILILVCYGIGFAYIGVWFKNRQKDIIKLKSKWLDKNIWDNIEILAKIIYSILMLSILILLTSEVYSWFKELFWDSFSQYFTPIVLIIITLIVIIIVSQVIKRLFKSIRIALKKRPGVVKSETLKFIELTSVYLVYVIGLTIVLVIALGMAGLSEEIAGSLTKFFEINFAMLLLVIIFLVIFYAISRFATAYITDLKKESTRFNPNTLDYARNMTNYILLIFAVILIVYSLFSFTGLSDIGETFLTTIIIVIGLVLAMSASGTLGNFFAGLVLLFTSPYEHGDTIKIGNGLEGRVQTKALFTTVIRTNDGEDIKMPNSKILDSQIVNYSNMPKAPITVDVNVNYSIMSDSVHKLLITSAEETKDIDLDELPPKVYTKKFGPENIRYRLLVYMVKAGNRDEVYSELLDNIQKTFKKAKIKFSG